MKRRVKWKRRLRRAVVVRTAAPAAARAMMIGVVVVATVTVTALAALTARMMSEPLEEINFFPQSKGGLKREQLAYLPARCRNFPCLYGLSLKRK